MSIELEEVLASTEVSAVEVCRDNDRQDRVFVIGLKNGSHIFAEADHSLDDLAARRGLFKLTLNTNGLATIVEREVPGSSVSERILSLIKKSQLRIS